MFLIRSIAQANLNRRDEAVRICKEFMAEMKNDGVGTNHRVLTGSIGPSDSTVIMEVEHKSLADFEQSLAKSNQRLSTYGPKFAELMIPGSHSFEIYRICD